MISPQRQSGLAAAAIVVMLILALVAVVLGSRFFDSTPGLDQRAASDTNLKRVSESLSRFVMLNQRLPCPASGTADSGLEDASSPFATCNSPDGVVPWATLALGRGDALDGWGRKISYRVYSPIGSGLTQLGGASMSDCNSNAAATGAVNASGLCPATRQTPPAAFLAGKGLFIQTDAGPPTGGFAFVLISHGETGLGAFAADGGGRSVLPPVGSLERPNTQAGTTYNQRTRSAVGTQPTDATYFDDTVLAVSISAIVGAAKLTARDWGVSGATTASTAFTASTVESALGVASGTLDPSTNANTETNDINFGDIRVRAFTLNGALESRNVSYGQGATGQGLGVIASSHNANSTSSIDAGDSEALRFQFTTAAQYLGISLIDFGSESGQFERVRLTFKQGGSTVQVTKTACRTGNVIANFTANPGITFDEVLVEALTTLGGADNSRFLIKSIATCPSSNPACQAPGAVAADNCP